MYYGGKSTKNSGHIRCLARTLICNSRFPEEGKGGDGKAPRPLGLRRFGLSGLAWRRQALIWRFRRVRVAMKSPRGRCRPAVGLSGAWSAVSPSLQKRLAGLPGSWPWTWSLLSTFCRGLFLPLGLFRCGLSRSPCTGGMPATGRPQS